MSVDDICIQVSSIVVESVCHLDPRKKRSLINDQFENSDFLPAGIVDLWKVKTRKVAAFEPYFWLCV